MPDLLPDLIAPELSVLFCGINPGAQAAATGHHFVGRGNRFWKVLHLAGFTPSQIEPESDRSLLQYGFGLTTLVARATARAAQVERHEFLSAAAALEHKLQRYRPAWIAFLGKAAYAALSEKRQVEWGRQNEPLASTQVWVLPNPSGLNRGFSLQQLVDAYRLLRVSIVLRKAALRPRPRA